MNGAINVSIPDGWFPEFARDGVNSFVIPDTEVTEHKFQQDETDVHNLYALLKNKVISLYYDHPHDWLTMVKHSMRDILPQFDSRRLAEDYYELLYKA
jgi:starch phosphorylase